MPVNFEAMLSRPVDFTGKPKPAPPEDDDDPALDDVPAPLILKGVAGRRVAQMKKAAEILEHLPQPGESTHFLLTGRYDLADVLGCLLKQFGKADEIHTSTLSYAKRNVDAIKRWFAAGLIGRLVFLCSTFFKDYSSEEFEALRQVIAEQPGSAFGHWRCHAKIICVRFGDVKWAIESSANWRSSSNWETATLFQDATVYGFHRDWIAEAVEKHRVA